MSLFPPEDAARFRAEGHWGDVTLTAMFDATCARVPERLGIVDPLNRAEIFQGAPRRLTYAQMHEEVARYASVLRAQGLGQGSIIATQLPSVAEMMLLYLAVARIGAILSPISIAYRAAELKAQAQVCRFDAYVSVGQLKGQDFYAERLPALAPGLRLLGIGTGLPEGVTRIDDADAKGDDSPAPVSADDLFAVFWTSGTEGLPKAVPKTHNNMMASSLGAWRILGLPDGAGILAPFPFVNAAAMGGLMMCWMRTAGALILHHPFDTPTFLRQLAEEEVAYTMVAPTLLVYLRERADDPALGPALKRLRAIGTGSAPPDPEVFAFFQERLDVPVLNFFGSNEGAQMCAGPGAMPDPRRRARVFPRDGDEGWSEGAGLRTANGGSFRLIDPETGAIVTEPGALGEMYLRGPSLMPGYYHQGRIDRSRFDAEGYFPTADLFRISDCGRFIAFHARARELILRGGMKISPVELDGFLSALPGMREVAVAAYPDAQMGEKVCLFAVPEAGHELTLAQVQDFCDRKGLAKFKWPERLILCESLPRTPLAKLDRKALARQLAEDTPMKGAEHA